MTSLNKKQSRPTRGFRKESGIRSIRQLTPGERIENYVRNIESAGGYGGNGQSRLRVCSLCMNHVCSHRDDTLKHMRAKRHVEDLKQLGLQPEELEEMSEVSLLLIQMVIQLKTDIVSVTTLGPGQNSHNIRFLLECYAHQKRCNIFRSVRMRKYFCQFCCAYHSLRMFSPPPTSLRNRIKNNGANTRNKRAMAQYTCVDKGYEK